MTALIMGYVNIIHLFSTENVPIVDTIQGIFNTASIHIQMWRKELPHSTITFLDSVQTFALNLKTSNI